MHSLVHTFGGYLRTKLHRQPRTIEQYLSVIEAFAAFQAGSRPIEEAELLTVKKQELTDYLGRYAETRPLFNQQLAALRSFFDYLLDVELVETNPARLIQRFTVKTRKKRIALSLDEFLALLRAIEAGPRYYRSRNLAIVLLLFLCPLRVSELVSLNLSHLDWQGRWLVDVVAKGADTMQSLPIPLVLFEALGAYITERPSFRISADEVALFVSDRGQRISVRQIEELIANYGQRAGIRRPVSPHLLRHSSATAQAERGLSLWGLQQLLNHESILATQRYVHVFTNLRPAIDALGSEVAERWQKTNSVVRTSSAADHIPGEPPPSRQRSSTAPQSDGEFCA